MKFCDAYLNPTYLKLVDGVYHHFIYVLAVCSRFYRKKNVAGLDLFNCVEEIKNITTIFVNLTITEYVMELLTAALFLSILKLCTKTKKGKSEQFKHLIYLL